MKALNTNYVDLYYLHRINPEVPGEKVAEAMGKLIDEGLIRGWGLSQVEESTIKRAHEVTPVSAVQNLYNMLERDCETNTFPYCLEHNIGVVPFSPIASGFLSGKITKDTAFEKEDDVRVFVPQLKKENIEANDWSVLLAATPNNEDKLLWCLGYTGTLCALDATDFDDWVVYCSTVVLSALEACGVEASDERKNLLSIGLAARTFNFSGNPVTKNLKCAETIQGAASYNCTEDADIFSMWYLLQVLTEYLRLDFNGNLRELIDAMKTMNKIRDRYRQIADRLPKMDAC